MHKGTILLVEDSPNDVELTLLALERRKIANPVVVAKDGAAALDYLFCTGEFASRDPQDKPIFVLLDLKLPKVDGIEVLRTVRNDPRTKNLLVIIMTSSNEDNDVVASYDLYANSYIRKPLDHEEFNELIGRLGIYWLVVNVPPPKGS